MTSRKAVFPRDEDRLYALYQLKTVPAYSRVKQADAGGSPQGAV